MNNKLAYLFPGQGAQYPGMGKDFYDSFAVAREVFEEADTLLQMPFSKLIFEGALQELTLTKNSQIAIYITSIAFLRVIEQQFPHLVPTFCAGLSLGEYTALTAARKMHFADCLNLVRIRAEAMHQACLETQGSMQVILGMEEAALQNALQEINPLHPVWIANLNCPGQIVIAGSHVALAFAGNLLKQKGAKRILSLEVSGAFHSGLMLSAQKKLASKIAHVPLQSSPIDVVMNVSGEVVSCIQKKREALIDQVVSPVRWEKSIRNMAQQKVTAYIEIGPGTTLAGMNKRTGINEPTYSIEKIADLEKLNKLAESYAASQT